MSYNMIVLLDSGRKMFDDESSILIFDMLDTPTAQSVAPTLP